MELNDNAGPLTTLYSKQPTILTAGWLVGYTNKNKINYLKGFGTADEGTLRTAHPSIRFIGAGSKTDPRSGGTNNGQIFCSQKLLPR